MGYRLISWRTAQRIHCLLKLVFQIPAVSGVNLLLQRSHLGQQGVVVGVWIGQLRRNLIEAIDLALELRNSFLDVSQNRLLLIQRWLLHQNSDGKTLAQASLAIGWDIHSSHDL